MIVAGLAFGSAPAAADQQPAILRAYGLDWIERIKDEAWPQPKEQRPVICLLDTGVAITPDTPADHPLGPIVARLSVEDPIDAPAPTGEQSLGLPQGDTWTHFHGTRMAAIIGAPRNGVGTVGVFPQARIVSVRVTVGSEVYITPADVDLGVSKCRSWSVRNGIRVAAIVMAESLYDQREQDASVWESASASAASIGAVMVAAIGNDPNAAKVAPASVQSIVSVGAGTDEGSYCDFSPKTPGVLIGPGCSGAAPGWPKGSSSATAVVGALVGVLSTRDPKQSVGDLRAGLESASTGSPRRLLGSLVSSRFAGLVADTTSPSAAAGLIVVDDRPSTANGSVQESQLRLWRPGVVLRWRKGRLLVERTTHRSRGVLKISIGPRLLSVKQRRASYRLERRPRRAQIWAESADGQTWKSLAARVKVR